MAGKREITFAEAIDRKKKGLPPFPTEEEWEKRERRTGGSTDGKQYTTLGDVLFPNTRSTAEDEDEKPIPLLKAFTQAMRESKPRKPNDSVGEATKDLLTATDNLTPAEEQQLADVGRAVGGFLGPIVKQLIEKKTGVKFPEKKRPTHDVELSDIE
jgi:hypothetical protein